MPSDPEDIRPPFSQADEEAIRKALEEAQIDPGKTFQNPPKEPDKDHAGQFNDKSVPKSKPMENYNGQKEGHWNIDQNYGWQPGCEQPFSIIISETWTPPPADLSGKFKLWSEFATLRAVLICRRNTKCRRVQPLGCNAAWDQQHGAKHFARASFVFQCVEI